VGKEYERRQQIMAKLNKDRTIEGDSDLPCPKRSGKNRIQRKELARYGELFLYYRVSA
jgi:hypothetical protein